MRSLKYGLLAALFAAGCGGQMNSDELGSTEQAMTDNPQHIQYMRDAKPGGSTSGGNLIDHGGKVLPSDTTYAIWWGPTSGFPSDAVSGIDALLQGVNGTSFLSVGNQYMRGSSATSSFAGNLYDSSAPPTRAPKTSAIVSEACKVIGAAGIAPNPNALYIVYTSTFPGHTNYCAWHSYGTCNGTTIQVAYMPNTTGVAGCDPGDLYGCNSYSQGTRSLANVTSHEFMEAITDANSNAWYDGSGSEIGDKCAWQFSSCVNLKNGNWQLQEEYSNSVSGCVQQ